MSLLRPITHMISCKDASRFLSQLQDGRLKWSDRVKLRLHLMACKACQRFERQLRFMREAMRRLKA